MICPDRTLIETGQNSSPYNLVNCNPAANTINDPKLFPYTGTTETCIGDFTPVISIQNNGIAVLTSLDSIRVKVSTAMQVIVYDSVSTWSGNLQTYQSTNIILPTITGLNGYEWVEITIGGPNGTIDPNNTNNTIAFTIYPGTTLTASITQSSGVITANVFSGTPPYSYLWSTGETTQSITPTNGGSYSVVVTDVNQCVSNSAIFVFTSTGIEDIDITNLDIYYGTYDILGRKINDLNILSPGTMYIQGGKKFIK